MLNASSVNIVVVQLFMVYRLVVMWSQSESEI